jgi:hypothetical protein
MAAAQRADLRRHPRRADQGAPQGHQGRLRIQPPARRRPWKNASHPLSLEIVTPLGDDYELLSEAKCILRSSESGGPGADPDRPKAIGSTSS